MGFLDRVAGIIVGQFTDYRPDRNFPDMYTMLDAALSGVTCPVAFNFPVGHVDHNIPLLSGAPATFSVTPSFATLRFM